MSVEKYLRNLSTRLIYSTTTGSPARLQPVQQELQQQQTNPAMLLIAFQDPAYASESDNNLNIHPNDKYHLLNTTGVSKATGVMELLDIAEIDSKNIWFAGDTQDMDILHLDFGQKFLVAPSCDQSVPDGTEVISNPRQLGKKLLDYLEP